MSVHDALEPVFTMGRRTHKEDVQREMRRLIKKQLKVASFPAAKIDTVTESVVDLLKRRGGGA
jgi:type I restriction enzyme R subunit